MALAAAFVSAPTWLIGLEGIPYASQLAPVFSYYLGIAHDALGITTRVPQLTNSALIGFTLAAAGTMLASRQSHVNGTGRRRSAYA